MWSTWHVCWDLGMAKAQAMFSDYSLSLGVVILGSREVMTGCFNLFKFERHLLLLPKKDALER